MNRSNVRAYNSGFTLVEMLVVVIMVGILGSIAAPSFVAAYAKSRVNSALEEVQSALLEGQRQSIRNSRSCNVTIDTASEMVMGPCLLNGNRELSNVSIRTSNPTFRFDIRGTISNTNLTPIAQPITVVVSSSNTGLQRCLVISTPLGLVRTGTYDGTDTVEANCLP